MQFKSVGGLHCELTRLKPVSNKGDNKQTSNNFDLRAITYKLAHLSKPIFIDSTADPVSPISLSQNWDSVSYEPT